MNVSNRVDLFIQANTRREKNFYSLVHENKN